MSIARHFLREFRPFFRMLEEPLGRSPAYYNNSVSRALFEDPFFAAPSALRPAIDVTEQANAYVVEADLPGVKKENVDVRIGEGGQALIIEGKIMQRQRELAPGETDQDTNKTNADSTVSASNGSTAVTQAESASNPISTERSFTSGSAFTRTVWLPRPVDANGVVAKLSDGVLTVTIPKVEDRGSVKINVD